MPREEPAVDPQRQNELAKEERKALEVERSDFKKVLSLPEGRRTMRRILEALHGGPVPTDLRAFNGDGSLDVQETIGNLGAWGVGQALQYRMIEGTPDAYIKMIVESIRDKAMELKRERELIDHDKEQEDEILG